MKFDPARFASIRAREQKEEPVVKSDLDMLREITSVPCGVVITPALKAMAANTRAAIAAADEAKKPAQVKIDPPPNKKLTKEEIDEQRRLEDEAETAEMLKSFSKSQPNDFEFKVDDQARKNAAANMARVRAGFKLNPNPEGEAS